MALDLIARPRAPDTSEIPVLDIASAPVQTRSNMLRFHVLKQNQQDKSGRLYCDEDGNTEIPSLEIYAAR
jgi:hypothetical protein